MDNKINDGNNTDLISTGLSNLAKLIGIAVPSVNVIAIIADNINDRRNKKRIERLNKLFLSFGRRLTQVECKCLESSDIDLLDEIIAKAVSDEDEDKTELYAALVQYWMENKLVSYEIRLLGNAIKELTIYEMKSFFEVMISHNWSYINQLPKQLQDIFRSRVEYLGLLKKGGTATQIGQRLVEIYKLSITTK
jgi:hypothetical protein